MTAGRRVRRLSDGEATFAYQHALLRGTTQVTTCVTFAAPVEPAALRRAVPVWAARFAALSVRIEEGRDGLWFRESAGVAPEQLVVAEAGPEESADLLLRRELNDLLVTGGPLWRLRAAVRPDGVRQLFFTRNHAVSDGYTAGILLRGLLAELYGGAGAASAAPLLPSADDLTYRPPAPDTGGGADTDTDTDTDTAAAARAAGSAASATAPVAGPPVPFAATAPWPERGADFLPLVLTAGESARVLGHCRADGLTVNEFFATALAEAFAGATGRAETDFFTAVSLRRRYTQAAAYADPGCLIGVVRSPLRLDGDTFAADALTYRAAFRAADAAWRPGARPHAAIRAAVVGLGEAAASPGICITNVGVLDPLLGPYADRLTDIRTVVNRTAANYNVVLHLSTFQGRFGLALAYGTPSVDPAVVARTHRSLAARAVSPDGCGLPRAAAGPPSGAAGTVPPAVPVARAR
ncbi:hypothetical protein [Actinacidiphila sp. ITFR-21]|uniref:hypothetical protein n=1 Tax=Actinacidiphila sp. ITFR-21 TaxID=3075199 RepID=UPI00288BB798|nr:hypothetical protein [Streptomyces sp. ITFR-21]WNI16060.1 hypothetical protein RLT57_11325 [Streptomyces sp. ITFR-21]